MKEIDFRNATYDDIVEFVMNMLDAANTEPGRENQAIRTAYYASIAFVLVAKRLDSAVSRLENGIAEADGRLRDTLQQATRLFLDAADRAKKASDKQSTLASAYAKHLTFATWVLAGATIVLGVATCVLVYYTRLMALAG
jgi:hypothetical protein